MIVSGSAESLEMSRAYYDFYDEDGSKESWAGHGDDYKGKFAADKRLGVGEMEDYFEIPFFREKDGKQYAVGFNNVQSGEEIYIGLARL